MEVPSTLIRIPSQWPLASLVTSSHLSANDKGDNQMKPRDGHISSGLYVKAEKNDGKTLLRPMKAVRPVIDLNGVPYL